MWVFCSVVIPWCGLGPCVVNERKCCRCLESRVWEEEGEGEAGGEEEEAEGEEEGKGDDAIEHHSLFSPLTPFVYPLSKMRFCEFLLCRSLVPTSSMTLYF